MTESEALLAIQELMSGVEWTPGTLEAIASIMEAAGYEIEDID